MLVFEARAQLEFVTEKSKVIRNVLRIPNKTFQIQIRILTTPKTYKKTFFLKKTIQTYYTQKLKNPGGKPSVTLNIPVHLTNTKQILSYNFFKTF